MISVKLIAATKLVGAQVESEFLALASHAASKCYQAESPQMGKLLDVKNRLFQTSHHTTLEHFSFSFDIEGIAVSDITLGAHLTSPFYNSDQRSGRFCAKMFEEPDFDAIKDYITFFWPDLVNSQLKEVDRLIKAGAFIYHDHIEAVTGLVAELIASERPYASDKYIKQNAPKIAQEQLRMFISTIFPTGFDFTLDHIALASLYRSAWTPGLMYLTQLMVDKVLAVYPEIAYMFSRRGKLWSPAFDFSFNCWTVEHNPECTLLNIDGFDDQLVIPESEDMYPIDLLHFLPEMMQGSVGGVKTRVKISLACMGQDQRHRTIRRGIPVFTGNFYRPPIIKCFVSSFSWVRSIMEKWINIIRSCPPNLAAAVAPYGAMVSYEKLAPFNALFHEQNKRLCWCAQEEIYHLGRSLRLAIEKEKGKDSRILRVLEPHCYQTGKCAEEARYCGRDISARKSENYFPERMV